MKKISIKYLSFIILLASALSATAVTNVYLNISDNELLRRIAVITNLERIASATNVTYSAGPADIGFVSQTISEAFTNANFTMTDLSAYVGTNVARVTLQFYAIASSTVSIRTYGDTNTVDDTSMNSVAIYQGQTADMTVNTDSAGRIDVKATANTSMRLICFLRRHVFQ